MGQVTQTRSKGLKRYGTATVIAINHPRKTPDLERTIGDESVEPVTSPAFDSQVSVRIHSYRCRLVDVDGVSSKALLDGLVLAGIIANDTTKEVREVLYSQTKVKNKADEKAIVTIERV
jgi:hypothetical protein